MIIAGDIPGSTQPIELSDIAKSSSQNGGGLKGSDTGSACTKEGKWLIHE
jgi:hypothetical protein